MSDSEDDQPDWDYGGSTKPANGPCLRADFKDHDEVIQLRERIRELEQQCKFNEGYVATLKELGLPERFLEEYQSQKMRIRELEQALQSEVECTEIKLKGASERALMVLDSKNHFADKCRELEQQLKAAQERLAEAEELLRGMLECGELLPLLTKDYFAKHSNRG